MPNDLGNAKNFKTLCVDFALRVGLIDYTDGALALPDDVSDLETIKRFVNDGYREFMRSDPDWSFLVQTVSITFAPDGDGPDNYDRDPSKYRLPGWVSSRGLGDFEYSEGSGLYASAKPRSIADINRMRQTQATAGYPYLYAEEFVPTRDKPPARRVAPIVVFYPTPSAVYTVRNQYRVTTFAMDADEDVPVCGPEHDDAVLAAALWRWERHDKPGMPQEAAALGAWNRALEQSRAIDDKRRGEPLGQMVRTCDDDVRDIEDHSVPLYIEGYRQV